MAEQQKKQSNQKPDGNKSKPKPKVVKRPNPSQVPAVAVARERMSVKDIKFDESNPRAHPQRNLEAIGASLKQFGQMLPLLLQKSTSRVIAGNATLRQLRALGAQEVDVSVVDVDDDTAALLSVALNRSGEHATWDTDNLTDILEKASKSGLEVPGFSMNEVKSLLDDRKMSGLVANGGDANIDMVFFEEEDIKRLQKEKEENEAELKRVEAEIADAEAEESEVEEQEPIECQCPKCGHKFSLDT